MRCSPSQASPPCGLMGGGAGAAARWGTPARAQGRPAVRLVNSSAVAVAGRGSGPLRLHAPTLQPHRPLTSLCTAVSTTRRWPAGRTTCGRASQGRLPLIDGPMAARGSVARGEELAGCRGGAAATNEHDTPSTTLAHPQSAGLQSPAPAAAPSPAPPAQASRQAGVGAGHACCVWSPLHASGWATPSRASAAPAPCPGAPAAAAWR